MNSGSASHASASRRTRPARWWATIAWPIACWRLLAPGMSGGSPPGMMFCARRAMPPAALEAFAAQYHRDVPRLESLLALDAEEKALLTRDAATSPDADAVAALYNQWVFEAALSSSSEVRFAIDCAAFLEAQRTGDAGALTGIGAVIKRLCYLARRLGVYYDLAYEETLTAMRSMLLHLTLYGPQEMTGTPQ